MIDGFGYVLIQWLEITIVCHLPQDFRQGFFLALTQKW